jgi:hypothetical protein
VVPQSKASLQNGLKLNAFSLVNLTVCVGISIEFTAHLAYNFLAQPGQDSAAGRDERVRNALGFMGPAIVHGSVTSLIAAAALSLSSIQFIVEYYFFMFFFMVVIATLNGLLLLPVLLSLMGDSPVSSAAAGSSDHDAGEVAMRQFSGHFFKEQFASGDRRTYDADAEEHKSDTGPEA